MARPSIGMAEEREEREFRGGGASMSPSAIRAAMFAPEPRDRRGSWRGLDHAVQRNTSTRKRVPPRALAGSPWSTAASTISVRISVVQHHAGGSNSTPWMKVARSTPTLRRRLLLDKRSGNGRTTKRAAPFVVVAGTARADRPRAERSRPEEYRQDRPTGSGWRMSGRSWPVEPERGSFGQGSGGRWRRPGHELRRAFSQVRGTAP